MLLQTCSYESLGSQTSGTPEGMTFLIKAGVRPEGELLRLLLVKTKVTSVKPIASAAQAALLEEGARSLSQPAPQLAAGCG